MQTTKGMLDKVLSDLKSIGDVEASAIVSRNGLLKASDVSSDIRAETLAAMSATMLGAAETATSELKKGIPNRVIVEFKEAELIAMGAGPQAILVTMTNPGAGLGLILVRMEKASEKVKGLL
ncbi:MAG: roadblock/LC7 domain-containing protein [Methanocellales archaeon]|nr:roadblock/LC7 domain-containing protein [Methanocellales archaeon]